MTKSKVSKFDRLTRSKIRMEKTALKLENTLKPLRLVFDNIGSLTDGIVNMGVAFTGHNAFKKLGRKFPDTLQGSLIALIGWKLARAQNVAASIAGIGTLTTMGLIASWQFDPYRPLQPIPEGEPAVPPEVPPGQIPPGMEHVDIQPAIIHTDPDTGAPFLACLPSYTLMENFLGRIACIPDEHVSAFESWGWRIALSA